MTVQLRIQLANAPYTSLSDQIVELQPNQWTQIQCSGQTPATDIFFQFRTIQTGTLWLDDASLTARGAPALQLPTNAVPRSYFGMHIKDPNTAWPPVDFGTERLWNTDTAWSTLEPQQGTYNFNGLDSRVATAQQHNADIVLALASTPQWASQRPTEYSSIGNCTLPNTSYPNCGGAAPPKSMQDWTDFVTAVAQRYQGKIHYYEIWNEPDLTNFFTGTPEDLFNMVKAAANALHAVDPTIQIISPPSSSSVGWLDRFLALGGAQYVNIIGFHFYATDNPEYMPIQIENVKYLMQQYKLSQPLWDTEAASGTSQTAAIPGAGFVARDYILNWAAGAERFMWYAWDNHDDYPGNGPLVQYDNTTITRAATAYAVVENWLTGSVMLSLSTDAQNTYTVQLQRADGSNAWIVWNPVQPQSFTIPQNWSIQRVQDDYGLSSDMQGVNTIQVAASPLLLEQTQPAIPTPPRPPLSSINPVNQTPAANADVYAGGDCSIAPYYGGNMGNVDAQTWMKFSNVTLPANLKSFTASIQTFSGVNAHLQVFVVGTPQSGCGLTNGGTLTGGTQIADLTVTPSSPQGFQGPFASEQTGVIANYPTGQHDVYILATGTIGNIGFIQFG